MAHDRLRQKRRPHADELAVYSEVGRLLGASYAPTSDGVAQYDGTAEANAET
ncbi:MAG: hypothetical protein AVDCRST_MAG55-2745 [uncultured Rubrobacteraceae bacterium]|uniref:Uncharacterized protein n=1 Tax=uncultured Rubrobacteraceae bacterium TaxID=349277 RepID=A0A6J4QA03_9ACTN|nr:MAG: hypothetical protein AVDCRST_MAG55-2745 [uncultured Rubrobacteraceae bacterium]